LLLENGKDQKELCGYLGLAPSVFSDWKSGKSKSYKRYMDQIAEFFGCTVDYLLGSPQGGEAELSHEEINLLKDFRALSEASRKVARDTMKWALFYQENRTMLVPSAARGGAPPGFAEITVEEAERLKSLPGREQDGPI